MSRYIPPIINGDSWVALQLAVDRTKHEEAFIKMGCSPGFEKDFQRAYSEFIEELTEEEYSQYISTCVERSLQP